MVEVQGLLCAGTAPLAGAPLETLVSGPFVCLLTNCRNICFLFNCLMPNALSSEGGSQVFRCPKSQVVLHAGGIWNTWLLQSWSSPVSSSTLFMGAVSWGSKHAEGVKVLPLTSLPWSWRVLGLCSLVFIHCVPFLAVLEPVCTLGNNSLLFWYLILCGDGSSGRDEGSQ